MLRRADAGHQEERAAVCRAERAPTAGRRSLRRRRSRQGRSYRIAAYSRCGRTPARRSMWPSPESSSCNADSRSRSARSARWARAVGSTDATVQGCAAGRVQIAIDAEAILRGGGRCEASRREGAAVPDIQLADLAAPADPVRRIGSHHLTGVATNAVRVVVSCVDDVAAGTSVDRIEPDALDGVHPVASRFVEGPRWLKSASGQFLLTDRLGFRQCRPSTCWKASTQRV